MSSDILKISLDKYKSVPVLPGGNVSLRLSIKNTSPQVRLYNLGIALSLPDGLDLYSSSVSVTSKVYGSDGSAACSWVNLKDLAPLEDGYYIDIAIKCNTKFKNESTIPFGYIFKNISLTCQMDTMPRGLYDIGNHTETAEPPDITFMAVQYSCAVSPPQKSLKGAGTLPPLKDYSKVYTTSCQLYNNSISMSAAAITLLLANGIRYIGSLTATGTDSSQLGSPIISKVIINGVSYTSIYFGNVQLSIGSNTTFSFKYGIWNKYDDNSGTTIPHGTSLGMQLSLSSPDYTVSYSSATTAMDIIISVSSSKPVSDVAGLIRFYYSYEAGQYYDIDSPVINCFLPDGISYGSSSLAPYSVTHSQQINGTSICYHASNAFRNALYSFYIDSTVSAHYDYKKDSLGALLPVVSFDSFTAASDIVGTIVSLVQQVTDSASAKSYIAYGTIKKLLKGLYYRTGEAKSISCAAPLDQAEFSLSYSASAINAMQKGIYIDDFFPLSAGPVDNLSYTYTGYTPSQLAPQLIAPHGVDFPYGDIPSHSTCGITFRVPILDKGSSYANNNLLKFKGMNTDGYSYSGRDMAVINIGSPNLKLEKSIAGPNKYAIRSGESYTYTVKVSNSNSLGTETDAFDFTITDVLSQWFTLDSSSVAVTGTGTWESPVPSPSAIIVMVKKLSPGSYISLNYKVRLSDTIPPGLTITTAASSTSPYSQVYNAAMDNYQYSMNKTVSASISSDKVTVANDLLYSDVYKVGSPIGYKITVSVPIGTICYSSYINDTLPSSKQSYTGPCSKDGSLIQPRIASNVLTMDGDAVIDARISQRSIVYTLKALIADSSKTLNTVSSTQSNSCVFYYKQTESSTTYSTISKSLSVTVNHPNLVMMLSEQDKSTSIIYTSSAEVTSSSAVQFYLGFKNNSSIDLINCTVTVPVATGFYLTGINSTVHCSAYYDASQKKIVISIPMLGPGGSGSLMFTAGILSTLRSGTSITTQATAVTYYNNLSTKAYGGEKSNSITTLLPAAVSLLPDSYTMLNASTSYRVTHPGQLVSILNHFANTGGGYDDYTLTIQKVMLPYTLYIDNVQIAQVSANSLYKASPGALKNLPPGAVRTIRLDALIPSSTPSGSRFDFIINTQSLTSPNPDKTVLNIDPS